LNFAGTSRNFLGVNSPQNPNSSQPQIRRRQAGGLQAIEVRSPLVVQQQHVDQLVVLFHGYGADMTDLASLSMEIEAEAPGRRVWLFPNGHHEVDLGGHFTGRAWFPLRLAELEAQGVDFTQATPPGLERARDLAFKAVDLVREELGLTWSQVVLGGFSQGSMLALELTLVTPEPPRALVILSGSLVDEPRLRRELPRRKALRFFQSHGLRDGILNYELAEGLERVLRESGLDGQLLAFRGAHEIPRDVLASLAQFLKQA
jgi:phospholipase/carboxylesterase